MSFNYYSNFDVRNHEWVLDWKYPLITSIVYIIVSYGLKAILGTEKKVEHQTDQSTIAKKSKDGIVMYSLTQLHNLILIGLSFSMMCGILYEVVYNRVSEFGIFRGAICPEDNAPNPLTSGPISFWVFIYHISKYYELIDTMLIVLKRKPLIILHVYHHLIMIWITWSWLKNPWLVGSWWCIFVNSIIHTIMYYYYLQAARGKVLKWKNILTSLQIVQLWSGFLIVTYWFFIRESYGCESGFYAGVFSHLVNGTLILQFMQFFYTNYIAAKKKSD